MKPSVNCGKESAQECRLSSVLYQVQKMEAGHFLSPVMRRPNNSKWWFWDVCAGKGGGVGWKLDLRFPLLRIMPPLLWLQIRDWNWAHKIPAFPWVGCLKAHFYSSYLLKCSSRGSFGSRPEPDCFHLLIWWMSAARRQPPELACPSRRQYCRIFFDIWTAACCDRKS